MHRGAGQAFQLCRKMAIPNAEPQILVQYLVLRKDLSQAPFSWPAGAVVAQACHAATAALHVHRDHPHTVAYLQGLERMRKVVLEAAYKALQRVNGKWSNEEAVASGDVRYSSFGRTAPNETTLKELAETLQQKNINHILWLEQPENIATCIALRPYPKEEVNQYLKKFRLFK